VRPTFEGTAFVDNAQNHAFRGDLSGRPPRGPKADTLALGTSPRSATLGRSGALETTMAESEPLVRGSNKQRKKQRLQSWQRKKLRKSDGEATALDGETAADLVKKKKPAPSREKIEVARLNDACAALKTTSFDARERFRTFTPAEPGDAALVSQYQAAKTALVEYVQQRKERKQRAGGGDAAGKKRKASESTAATVKKGHIHFADDGEVSGGAAVAEQPRKKKQRSGGREDGAEAGVPADKKPPAAEGGGGDGAAAGVKRSQCRSAAARAKRKERRKARNEQHGRE
jgi:hypothetical protein